MKLNAIRQEGYQLLHEGEIALALVESNGIRIDMGRMARTKQELKEKIRSLKGQLEGDDIWKKWRRRFGEKSNIASRDQIAAILYQELGYEASGKTASGKDSTNEEALQKIDHPFVRSIVRMSKYEKALNTFLKGIEQEVVNNRLHPVFNLASARTYRSSSDSPNFQNFPVRDKEISKIIRSHFIPSPDSVLVDNAFKGI